jgi:iron complex transport system substrate-binding protein
MYNLSIVRFACYLRFGVLLILSPLAFAREITDMTGRKVSVPDTITKVFGSAPPITYLIYAIDPNLLAGLNMPLAKVDQPYLNPVVHQLPVLGGWHGQGRTPNIEMLLNVKPDMTLLWANGYFDLEKHIEALNKVNMPTVSIKIDRLNRSFRNATVFR